MKTTGAVILQAFMFSVIMLLITTLVIYIGEDRSFLEYLFRWVTLLQFVILFLVWSFFFYFRNKRIRDQENQKRGN